MVQPITPVCPVALSRAATAPADPGVEDPPAGQHADNPNPSFELKPALGLTVIQYRNEAGKVDLSIPSVQQLDAYAADPASVGKPGTPSIVV